MTMGI